MPTPFRVYIFDNLSIFSIGFFSSVADVMKPLPRLISQFLSTIPCWTALLETQSSRLPSAQEQICVQVLYTETWDIWSKPLIKAHSTRGYQNTKHPALKVCKQNQEWASNVSSNVWTFASKLTAQTHSFLNTLFLLDELLWESSVGIFEPLQRLNWRLTNT